MTFKTMQEQEREAYITGHNTMAQLTAKLSESDEGAAEYEELIGKLNEEIRGLEDKVLELEGKILDLTAEIGDLRDNQ